MEQAEIVARPLITKLNPALGAEITGIDLSLPVTPEQNKAFRDALDT